MIPQYALSIVVSACAMDPLLLVLSRRIGAGPREPNRLYAIMQFPHIFHSFICALRSQMSRVWNLQAADQRGKSLRYPEPRTLKLEPPASPCALKRTNAENRITLVCSALRTMGLSFRNRVGNEAAVMVGRQLRYTPCPSDLWFLVSCGRQSRPRGADM